MFGLMALGFAGLVVLALAGFLFGAIALVFWLVLLPFRLLGFVFKALGALFLFPFLLVLGLILGALVGLPLLFVVLIPALPVVLLVLAIVWLARRGLRSAAPAR